MAKRIASILMTTPADPGCVWCRDFDRACAAHAAEALVEAMRAEHLVVLTVEAADEIIRQAKAEGDRG